MEILQDYEEYFQMGQLDGKSEEEMTVAFANPILIEKELVTTYQIEKVEKNISRGIHLLLKKVLFFYCILYHFMIHYNWIYHKVIHRRRK